MTSTSLNSQTRPRKLSSKKSITRGIAGAVFGQIPGIPTGKSFENRRALSESAVHPPLVAGIYGRKETGARSVVLAGHFPDEDYGDHFIYVGSGGREPGLRFGPQTCDQNFDNSLNESLRMSACLRKPVRVIRGSGLKSKYAPAAGFRYDGLYTVSRPRIEMGPKGFKICKFDFHRSLGQPPVPTTDNPDFHRSDIDIRREQYKEIRAAQAKARAASASGSRAAPINVDDAELRATSTSVDDDEEEDQEDIFGDIDDVEAAMEPVQGYLDELKEPKTRGARRKELLVHVGQYVRQVLEERREQGTDEGGRDASWWFDALWSYVGCAMPTERVLTPQTVEAWYVKFEEALRKKEEEEEERKAKKERKRSR